MLLIPCPHCGLRNEDEFVCWSEAEPRRPAHPATLSDKQWAEYVYLHDNAKGWVRERWMHIKGCRRWIVIERNTITHEIARNGELQ
jgi:heterotetrameric sarcosine oxidase delta subunit